MADSKTSTRPALKQSQVQAASDRPANRSKEVAKSDKEWPVAPGTKNPPNVKFDGKDPAKLDQGIDDFELRQLDGAKAVLRLGKEERLVDQADLHYVAKRISKGIQGTY